MSGALSSASCDISHETGGTICHGRRVLRRYAFLRVLGSASCDITDETGGHHFYGNWVLRLPISHTRQGVRCVTGLGFCVL